MRTEALHSLHISHEDDRSNRSPNPKPLPPSRPTARFFFAEFGSAQESDARERNARRAVVLWRKVSGSAAVQGERHCCSTKQKQGTRLAGELQVFYTIVKGKERWCKGGSSGQRGRPARGIFFLHILFCCSRMILIVWCLDRVLCFLIDC